MRDVDDELVRVYIQREEGGGYLPYDVPTFDITNDENGSSVLIDKWRYSLISSINKEEEPFGAGYFYHYDEADDRVVVLVHHHSDDLFFDDLYLYETTLTYDHCVITFDYVDPYLRNLIMRDYVADQLLSMSEVEQNGVLGVFVEAVEEEVINPRIARYGGRQRTSLADWKLFEQFSIDHPELYVFSHVLAEHAILYGRMRSQHEQNLSAMQSYWFCGMEMQLETIADLPLRKWNGGCTIVADVESRYYSRIFIDIDSISHMCDIQIVSMNNNEKIELTRIDILETLRYLTLLNFDHENEKIGWSLE